MLTQDTTTTWEQAVAASPADVYYSLTNNYALQQWLCAEALVDERPDGRFYAGWNDGYYTTGSFTAVVPDEVLAFTWRGGGETEQGRVKIALREQDGGTNVIVSYQPPEDASPEATAAIARRLQDGLENLASVLETGIDLRIARRPMIGIGLAENTPETAKQLGVPVNSGVRLTGVVEGFGAAAAGLQKDDVIVSIDDNPITTGSSLIDTMSRHKAGDTVEVAFYRGAEKHSRSMTLSPRKMPEYANTLEDLLARTREFYDSQNGQLAELFAGATEEEAEYRPAPGEWNAKEIVAHLVAVEEDSHTWILMMLDGVDYTQPFRNNTPLRVLPIVAVYPTVAELLEHLRRSSAVTLNILEMLPEEIVRRKFLFGLLSSWWSTGLQHTEEHVAELRKLLEQARASDE